MRLRLRAYLMILPLIVAVVSLGGVFAAFETRAALTGVANRYMAFKAEQLRDFFFSEWDVLTRLGLDKYPEYRTAVEKSFRSYALSLLRSGTEMIAVLDSKGDPLMLISLQEPSPAATGAGAETPPVGWFSGRLFGESRVGVAFELAPMGWKVAVTELETAFFSDAANIERTYIWILFIAVSVITVLLTIFIGYIVRPVERLTATMERIAETKDLTQHARVEFADEIGSLARMFNAMIGTLRTDQLRIEETSRAEHNARQSAVEREEEALFLLGRVSDFRDEETGRHLQRIGALSALFSSLLGQSTEEQELLRHSSPLHDIGKISIPDSILRKPGKLSPEEFEIMKRHVVRGHELLKEAKGVYLVEGAKIALTHHEKWDGSGYPAGLKGEEIPISGRIVGIADTIDALLSVRPYKDAWSFDRVIEHIVEQRGKQFDPRLVDLFQEHSSEFRSLIEA